MPLIRLLAIGGALHALQVNIESVYYALGKPKLKALITLLEVLVFVPLLLLTVPRYGLIGAAAALLLTVSIAAPVNFGLVLRMLNLGVRPLLSVLWRPFVAAACMAAAVLGAFPLESTRATSLDNLWAMLAAIALGAVVYAITIAMLWFATGRPAGAEDWLLTQARERRRSPARQIRVVAASR